MADVSDLSDVYDRIFSFVVFRHHLIHFYLSFPQMRFEGEIFGPHENVLHQDPPARHQIYDLGVAIEGQRRLDREVDRLGHRILQELRVTFRQLSSRARPGPASFKYCVYTMIVQRPNFFRSGVLCVTSHATFDDLRFCLHAKSGIEPSQLW